MTGRRLIGLDLNGVNDRLAAEEVGGTPECLELGLRGSLVRLLTQKKWVAGRQNETVPHGRGAAWGEIGDADNRIELLALFKRIRSEEAHEQEARALASALPGLTAGSERAVFAVPDIPVWDEAFRDRYLRLLTQARGPSPLLLWRPVAALLGGLVDRPEVLGPDLKVAVLSLMADGVHLAVLTLEREEGASLLVPVRRRSGDAAGASFRGERLIDDARRRLGEMSGLSAAEIGASAWSPWHFATGAEPPEELLRLEGNRGWRALPKLQHHPPKPDGKDLPDELLARLGEAEAMLVEGPFAGNVDWRRDVLAALRPRIDLPAKIECLRASTVARGCLEAARRDREGHAIYFDFLPQLQINALVQVEPEFVDLIAAGARCQGGKVFRRRTRDDYAINKGASQFTFWLFKEGFEHARRAEVQLPETADRRYPLTVEVFQTPGQGFAKVTISSPDFEALRREPIVLDWAEMTKVPGSREQILKEIGKLSGEFSWPETTVLPGHPIHWSRAGPGGNLRDLLVAYRTEPLVKNGTVHPPTWRLLKQLRSRFSFAQESRRALNSDGTLPDSLGDRALPADAKRELDQTLAKLEQDLTALRHSFGTSVAQ